MMDEERDHELLEELGRELGIGDGAAEEDERALTLALARALEHHESGAKAVITNPDGWKVILLEAEGELLSIREVTPNTDEACEDLTEIALAHEVGCGCDLLMFGLDGIDASCELVTIGVDAIAELAVKLGSIVDDLDLPRG